MLKNMKGVPKEMERGISVKFLRFLHQELPVWQAKGLVTPQAALGILDLYSVRRRSFARILLDTGAALLGLAAISVVAANWMTMPRALRMGLIIGIYSLTLVVACLNEKSAPQLSQALRLLAAMIFGGGIFLAAQMYHQGGRWFTAFGWWALGLGPAVLIFRDSRQMYVLQAAALMYLGGDGAFFLAEGGATPPMFGLLLVTLIWGLWLPQRKNLGIFNVNVALTLLFIFVNFLRCSNLASGLLSFFVLGLALQGAGGKSGEGWRDTLPVWGALLTGGAGLALSVPEVWRELSFLLPLDGAMAQGERVTRFLAAGAAALTAFVMSLRLYRGAPLGGVFIALLIARYFLDHFFGFMSKAAVFAALGLLCLVAGLEWERRSLEKRRNGNKEA